MAPIEYHASEIETKWNLQSISIFSRLSFLLIRFSLDRVEYGYGFSDIRTTTRKKYNPIDYWLFFKHVLLNIEQISPSAIFKL